MANVYNNVNTNYIYLYFMHLIDENVFKKTLFLTEV